jgi:HSP20 family molecular chaperone IbpA
MTAVTSPPQSASAAAAPTSSTTPARPEPALLPLVDVIEDSTGITLCADLPGVPREKLQLNVEGDQLAIEGEIMLAAPQGIEAGHAEVTLSRYRRTFTLSKELDPEKISAELNQGVLRVRIPKAGHAQPRKVSIQVM